MSRLLRVTDLSKTYKLPGYWLNKKTFTALDPISFTLDSNQTLAVVGEVGSGKSTLAKLLVGAEYPSTGKIDLDGEELHSGDFSQRCQKIRMIFQDSGTTLNPSLTVQQILDEPLKLNTELDELARAELMRETLKKVGMLPEHLHFYPHMFSGGQKQRISLARAIILQPEVLILDEALAALDPSLRSQMLNLLLDLQQQMGLAFVLISQNLGIVRHASDHLIVLKDGKVVEQGPTQEVFSKPKHKYTKMLMMSQHLKLGHIS
ncbi:ATP-binding cassette domain-containing protein [Thalassotalea sp. LPB0316]|uniref:ATP-binding cassette domain-containing protein n=1 Tax=Thalassotalea sp. LPB0316 TaxID=2769490 RepID=UPI001865EDC8|nr:ATP-binding cassette domain-containing protein [Thalassotalea sp. LPB0316]QOL27133.1 ATP-binding cassette domain-containing protein [Thalassotalea sp. LPB0316]